MGVSNQAGPGTSWCSAPTTACSQQQLGQVMETSPRGQQKGGTCLSASTTGGQGVRDAVRVDVALVIPLLCGRPAQGRSRLGRLGCTRRAGRVVEVLRRSRDHGTEPLPEDICGIHLRGFRLLRDRKGIDRLGPPRRDVWLAGWASSPAGGFSSLQRLCLWREGRQYRVWL